MIRFSLPSRNFVSLKVYDLSERRLINTLVNFTMEAGTYNIKFDGANLASGIYFYRLETPSYTNVKKMIFN